MIFFAELDGGFQILEEYVPRILYYSNIMAIDMTNFHVSSALMFFLSLS